MFIFYIAFGLVVGAIGAAINFVVTGSYLLTFISFSVYGILGMLGTIAGIEWRQRTNRARADSKSYNKTSAL